MVRPLIMLLMALCAAGSAFAAVDCVDYAKKAEASGDGVKMFAAAMYLDRLYDAQPAQDCRRQAAPLIAQAVKDEVPGALFQLGRMYVQQEKVSQEHLGRGFHYWEAAAKLGDTNAMTMMGATFERLIPVSPTQKNAMGAWTWYALAADRHNKAAMKRTADIRTKVDEAAKKFELSQDKMVELAAAYLGEEYTKGGRSALKTYQQTDQDVQAGLGEFAGRRLREQEVRK